LSGPPATPHLARQLRWLIAIRLVVITSVVVPYSLLQISGRGGPTYNFLYLLAGLTYLASLIYIALLRLLEAQLEAQAYSQFVGDLLIITGLVYYFGGISSPFSLLYLLVIAVAASLLRRRAGVVVATIAYGLYAGLLLGIWLGLIRPSEIEQIEPASGWRVIFNLAVHLFGFYAVAFLTSYLAHHASEAERELEAKREEVADLQVVHRDVIQSITSGLITTDRDGRITSVNRAGSEILGEDAAALIGLAVERSPLFTIDRWRRDAGECLRKGRARDAVDCLRGEETVHVGYAISRLADADGARTGFIVAFQDLTEVRKLQEEVRLKDRMAAAGELASGIAHEIGNPLAAISGSVQMLAASPSADPAQAKLFDIVLKESQRLDRTIKGFLRYARPRDRSSARFDIARLLAENVELLGNSDEVSSGHRLELELDPPSVTLIADPDQVSQIFWNLARNSLRAMPQGGTLRVAGRLAGTAYRIEVEDTGRGITPEERTRLFQPFKSFFDGGTGLGMAIVYRIVQEHGGRLAVDSRPSGGTRITVELPAVSAEVAAAIPAART
jgi:two-component system sensor histidine kinase PilS (NtrC family)